jgi:hypothetical protein
LFKNSYSKHWKNENQNLSFHDSANRYSARLRALRYLLKRFWKKLAKKRRQVLGITEVLIYDSKKKGKECKVISPS